MNKTVQVGTTTSRHPHLTKSRQIFVCLLVTGVCIIIIISFNPGYFKIGGYAMKAVSPKTAEDVMKTERINTTGVVMKTEQINTTGVVMETTKNKTTAYVMEVVYGGKKAPLEFDFTASDISEIVKSWRNHSKDMKWKIVDILKIVSIGYQGILYYSHQWVALNTIYSILEMILHLNLVSCVKMHQ